MTFKPYTTFVMNKLTYVSFHKVGENSRQQRWSMLLQFCCKVT